MTLVCTEAVEICVLGLFGAQRDDGVFLRRHARRDETGDERQRHADENEQDRAEHRQDRAQRRQTGQMVYDKVDGDEQDQRT